MSKCEVVHHIRGRVRLRIPDLKKEGTLEKLNSLFCADKRISSVSTNKSCNSLTLCYDHKDISLLEILDVIEPKEDVIEPKERVIISDTEKQKQLQKKQIHKKIRKKTT
ncbi:MAG: hypothetical protein H7844_08060 [Nitrospirae bacterium YQR-1]